jgi:putative phage-type endonuclease
MENLSDRQKWLEERRKGIGGSDLLAILGLSEYSSPYKVWLRKTGRDDTNVDNPATRRGTILEPAIADLFELETGLQLEIPDPKLYTHPLFPFCKGSPDRFVIINGKRGNLEIKTARGFISEVDRGWYCQVTWYTGIMKAIYPDWLDEQWIAWFDSSLQIKSESFNFDPEFFKYLLEKAEYFWNQFVIKDIPPPALNDDDLKAKYPVGIIAKSIDLPDELSSKVIDLKTAKIEIKKLEEKKDTLEFEIKEYMKDAEVLQRGSEIIATWKSTKQKETFDKDKLKAELPDVYNQYLFFKPGSRMFLLK